MAFTMLVDLQWSPFSVQTNVEMNEADARAIEVDMLMKEERCWKTGEFIQICRVEPDMICEVSFQDAC